MNSKQATRQFILGIAITAGIFACQLRHQSSILKDLDRVEAVDANLSGYNLYCSNGFVNSWDRSKTKFVTAEQYRKILENTNGAPSGGPPPSGDELLRTDILTKKIQDFCTLHDGIKSESIGSGLRTRIGSEKTLCDSLRINTFKVVDDVSQEIVVSCVKPESREFSDVSGRYKCDADSTCSKQSKTENQETVTNTLSFTSNSILLERQSPSQTYIASYSMFAIKRQYIFKIYKIFKGKDRDDVSSSKFEEEPTDNNIENFCRSFINDRIDFNQTPNSKYYAEFVGPSLINSKKIELTEQKSAYIVCMEDFKPAVLRVNQ